MPRLAACILLLVSVASRAAAQAPSAPYRFEPLPKTPAELAGRFTPAQIDILEMLNRRDRDKVYVSHGGSYPGYQTQTVLQLDGKVGVIVLTNADDASPAAMATQLMNTVGEAVAKVAATPAVTMKWDPSWSRFAGLYRGRGGDSQVVELNQRLVIISPDAANLDNPIRLEPLGNGQFRYVAPGGGGPVGEIVWFVEEGGRVVRMITGDSYVERVR